MKICSVDGCENKSIAKDLCSKHYWRLRVHGAVSPTDRMKGSVDRFWKKVDKKNESDCWEWTAQKSDAGYGRFRFNGGQLAHRYSFMIHNGYLPDSSRHVMHICDNPGCVNPFHLKDGSRRDNVDDMVAKGRHPGRSDNRGENNYNSKLTNAQAREVFLSPGTYKEVSDKLGVKLHTVADIKSGRRYKDATNDLIGD